MTWVRIDDEMPMHPKVFRLSADAFRLWIEAICYCGKYLTDGVVDPKFLPHFKARAVRELLKGRLFEKTKDGIEVHDFLDYQSSAARVADVKEKRKAAGAAGGRAKASKGEAAPSKLPSKLPGKLLANTPPPTPTPTPTPTPPTYTSTPPDPSPSFDAPLPNGSLITEEGGPPRAVARGGPCVLFDRLSEEAGDDDWFKEFMEGEKYQIARDLMQERPDVFADRSAFEFEKLWNGLALRGTKHDRRVLLLWAQDPEAFWAQGG